MALAEMNVRIGAVITDFQKKMQQVQESISGTSEKLQAAGDKMKGVGTTMTAGLTAPIGALGGMALKTASDFEGAQGRMQAQLGLTADEADSMGQIAREVWKGAFGTDMNDVTDSLATVKQNIQGLNDADLKTVTESAFTLRDAFGTDIKESTATASTMMKNFGIDANDAMDLMTVGFQKGGDYSGELMDTLREYSPQFAGMGHSAEDMMNILISGAEAGAWNLDKVGDAVKEFNIRAKDGSSTTKEGFEAIGLSADDMGAAIAEGGEKGEKAFQATIAGLAAMEDPVERNKAGVALFGTQWEDLEADVVSAMGTTEDKLGTVEGATKKAGDSMYDTFGTKLQETIRSLGAALEPLGIVLLDMAQQFLPPLIAGIEKVANWFTNLSPIIQKVIVIFGAIAAAIGPVLVILGMVVGAVGNLIPIIMKMGPVLNIVRTAFMALTGPIGLIVAGVILLATVIIANWDTIKAQTLAVWGHVKTFLSATWEWIKSTATQVFNAIKVFLTGIWTAVKIAATTVWNGIKAALSVAWDSIKSTATSVFNAIKNFFSNIWDKIKSVISTVVSSVVSFLQTRWENIKYNTTNVFNAIKNFFTSVWNAIKSFISSVVSSVVDFIKTRWENVKRNTTNAFNAVKDFLSNVWSSIKSKVSSVASAIVDFLRTRWENIKSNTTSAFNAVKSFLSNIWNNIKSSISNIVTNIKEAVSSRFEALKSAVQSKMEAAKERIQSIWDSVMDFFRGINLFDIGKDIIQGLIDGIAGMANKLWNKAKEIADGIKDKIKGALKIFSPSRVMRYEIGQQVGAGMIVGMEDMERSISRSAQNMANAAVPDVPQTSSVSGGGGTVYNFEPGSIVLDAKNVREFNDVVRALDVQTLRR